MTEVTTLIESYVGTIVTAVTDNTDSNERRTYLVYVRHGYVKQK